jgi:cytochrome c-type biogenesis protein CcmH/NrfG
MSGAAVRDRRELLERELLGCLGVERDAGPEQIEAAHDAVVDYLASAPRPLRRWARAQAAAADEAFALLSDPVALAERAEASAGSPVPPAPDERAEARARADTRQAPRRTRRAHRDGEPTASVLEEHAAGLVDEDDVDALIAEVTPSAHRDEVRRPARRSSPASGDGPRRWLRPVLAAGAVVAATILGIVIYQSGSAPTAASAASASAAASSSFDEAQVAALMARVQANPNDTDALMSLGDAFFADGQYDVAASWLAKLVAIEPANARALLALGAADYNSGNLSEAEQSWLAVIALDSENVEAHYDLGWVYAQQEPPDVASMRREWEKVLELAPGTDVAQQVQQHLDALASASPVATGSSGASSSPDAAATAVASPSVAP